MPKRTYTEGTWRNDPWFKDLCQALADCSDADEVADFLRDVATLSELQALSERFEVAKQVAQGRTYRIITSETGASTTTVTRVAKFLLDGEGGYKRALKSALHHHHPLLPRGERMASNK